MPSQYGTARAFRQALETRLMAQSVKSETGTAQNTGENTISADRDR
jgi:hypothetical protein